MANLFAYRATKPQRLRAVPDPVGPENDEWLGKLAQECGLVVAAWGNHGAYRERAQQVRAMFSELYCLGLTKKGQPKHPLYLPKSLKPVLFS